MMASSIDFVLDIISQLPQDLSFSHKKMFGEYGIFYSGKMIAMICDNQFFLKATEGGRALLPDCALQAPYPGAKAAILISEFANHDLLRQAIAATYRELPFPKSKTSTKLK